MNHKPEIAIVESNTLTCLGLKSILEENYPNGNSSALSIVSVN